MAATHSQPSAALTDVQRALQNRGADVCRRRPDHFAALVRYSDDLIAAGVDKWEAWSITLDQYDQLMAAPKEDQ